MKTEKKRKREDEKEEKQAAKVKEVGEKIKKEGKKVGKGKLKQLIKAVHSADPTKTKYIVLIIDFYDAPTTHLTLTPFNTDKNH